MHPLRKIGTFGMQPIDGQAALAVGMTRGPVNRDHEAAREEAIHRMRRRTFLLDGHRYRFRWSFSKFAKANRLEEDDPATERAFAKIGGAASMDMRDIVEAVRRARVRRVPLYVPGVGRLSRSALVVDWRVERLRCELRD
jgi:hypothetical protein